MSRVDDTVVLASGIKVDALALEHILDAQDEISRSAIVLSKSKEQLLALIEPSSSYQTQAEAVETAVLRVNLNLPYEKRVQRENIVFVDRLPLTTKATLHRKLVNKILSSNSGAWPLDRIIVSKSETFDILVLTQMSRNHQQPPTVRERTALKLTIPSRHFLRYPKT